MKIGVIISTYNNPAWLEKTLWGYMCQKRMADEIIIADDGSTSETRKLINTFSDKNEEHRKINNAIRETTRRMKLTRTEYGL